MASLSQRQDVPLRKMILLDGPLGAGKSIFWHQVAFKRLTADQPITYVTSKYGSLDAERVLKV